MEVVEGLGGTVTCRYFNRLALRVVLHPEKFWRIPKFALPTKARDIGKIFVVAFLFSSIY